MANNGKYVDWLSEIVQRHEKEGGFEDLPGLGKPLPKELLKDDLLTTVIKKSGYKPDWVVQQKKIYQKLETILKKLNSDENSKEIAKMISEVNDEIKKYNLGCPFPMQRNYVNKENLENQLIYWN
ncbi:DnaJ family domain-containing protein [Gottfriedia acidiceleris]|uniref:DnaJ family domain-containing protein n=1 Tax=Gottfriedia acidiceleris TaxID=371036 RepID=UPI000B450512|nr:DnaJ family domain-containing protein [Gottfriedia acidiceleris]